MAEALTLTQVLKEINKKYSDDKLTVAQIGVDKLKKCGTLSLGSPSLDFCLYNSLPEGKIIEFSGAESSGKTTVAFLVAADYIRKELERNPENPRGILFMDVECTADPDWALKSTGYDMNRQDVKTVYIQPTGQSAEQIFDMVIQIVKTGEIGLVIFDSLTMLVSQLVNNESMEKKDMGGVAKPLGDFCKKITGILNRNRTTFIGINGITENISGYGEKEITPGGRTWKRACMVRVRFKQGNFFNEDNEIIEKKEAQSPAGHIIDMYVYKTKVCRWDRKLGKCHLNYTKGVDIIWDTIELAEILGIIDNPAQGTYRVVDLETGETAVDKDGKPIKIRGKKNVVTYFKEHPEEWGKLYDGVYEKSSIKEDSNIVSFEKLLNININEELGFNLDTADQDNI
jgi:recombination protein RecA